jgi:hypothetical protein
MWGAGQRGVATSMPFRNYSVSPDLMEAMRTAFYRVCEVLQLSCDVEDPLTEVVVSKIVELAKAGDATRISSAARC